MFENISYRKKFLVLITLLIAIGITAYKRSYSITLDAYKSLKSSREKLKDVSNSQERIAILKEKVDYLDNIIGKKATNADLVQQEIINTFTKIKNDSDLVKLEEVHKANNEYFNIYTNRLLISGTFNELLATTYKYEKEFEFSRVVSVRFYVEKELRTRKKKLFEQIIFQNYEKID
ncbi:hypothetical protein [Allomuricauda sp. R78024]|uniref:hypothetical protein n=1 Tax=Allomuricauda sp. R78024 TaxID=3093867 RepID=UPI0037CB0F2D